MRIISLVPSITEALFDFGLTNKEIVGRTKFCIHPKDKVKNIPTIGGTKNIQIEAIKLLQPDLVIANKEENVKDQVEELMKFCTVWVTEIDTLEDNNQFIDELGQRLQQPKLALSWKQSIDRALRSKTQQPLTYTYLIWKKPYMTIGSDTFIHHVLEKLGLKNHHEILKRYPIIEVEDMKSSDCIFLSTEPFPFKQRHVDELQAVFPNKKITIVDGEAFSWYGTHIAKCQSYFEQMIKEISD